MLVTKKLQILQQKAVLADGQIEKILTYMKTLVRKVQYYFSTH